MKGCGTSVTPVIAGVRSDIERLLQKFIETPSVRFEHFAECFREAKFSLIFAGRTSENEVREFSEKILLTALSFCFPPYNFHVSVGGLYLIYALFYLQPKKYRMQIRITPEQFDMLQGFLQSLSEQQHLDSCYIMHKLLRDQAFYICAYSDEHNPLNFHRFDNKEDAEKAAETLRNSQTFVHELSNDNLIPQLQTIHEQYIILKKRLVNDDNLPDALSLVDKNPMEYVKNIIDECEERLERRLGVKKKVPGANVNGARAPSELTSLQKLKDRRKAIKELAYRSIGKQGRHVRYRQETASTPSVPAAKVKPEKKTVSKKVFLSSPQFPENDDEWLPKLNDDVSPSPPPVVEPKQKAKRGRPLKINGGISSLKRKMSLENKLESESCSGESSTPANLQDENEKVSPPTSASIVENNQKVKRGRPPKNDTGSVSTKRKKRKLENEMVNEQSANEKDDRLSKLIDDVISSSPPLDIAEDEVPLAKLKETLSVSKKIRLETV